jgi:hypothetical protein
MKKWTASRLMEEHTVLTLLNLLGPRGVYLSVPVPHAAPFAGIAREGETLPSDVDRMVEDALTRHITELPRIQEGPNGPRH